MIARSFNLSESSSLVTSQQAFLREFAAKFQDQLVHGIGVVRCGHTLGELLSCARNGGLAGRFDRDYDHDQEY